MFAFAHGLLISHDLRGPETFLSGDRSGLRFDKIRYLLEGQAGGPFPYMAETAAYHDLVAAPVPVGWIDRLLALGDPGDYALHAAVYALGGPALVVAVQLALAALAVVGVFRLARLLGQTPRLATIASLLYVLLPGSLMQPHQLGTEALFNPLVVLALWLLVANLEREFRWGAFVLALTALSLAIFIRVQLMLYPFVLALIVGYAYRPHCLGKIVAVVLIGLALRLGWTAFAAVEADEAAFRLASGLGLNLFLKVERMALIAGFSFDKSQFPQQELSPFAFLSFVMQHPVAYLRALQSDVVNFIFNPGAHHFALYI